jgi:hypothetical protein
VWLAKAVQLYRNRGLLYAGMGGNSVLGISSAPQSDEELINRLLPYWRPPVRQVFSLGVALVSVYNPIENDDYTLRPAIEPPPPDKLTAALCAMLQDVLTFTRTPSFGRVRVQGEATYRPP